MSTENILFRFVLKQIAITQKVIIEHFIKTQTSPTASTIKLLNDSVEELESLVTYLDEQEGLS